MPVLRLSQGTREQGSTLSLMAYEARWNSTDQVPQRLIDAGSYNGRPFGRYDTLDPTDGGSTSLQPVGEWHERDRQGETRVSAYAMHYALQLFSNFTYAMDRPATGDQFSQQDDRTCSAASGPMPGTTRSAAWRHAAKWACNCATTASMWACTTPRRARCWAPPGSTMCAERARRVRAEQRAADALAAQRAGPARRHRALCRRQPEQPGQFRQRPRQPAVAQAQPGGRPLGSRPSSSSMPGEASTATMPAAPRPGRPQTGEPVDAVPGLVAARGWELGVRTEAIANLQSSLAFWRLNSDSELVYVGDAGSTEASGASRRHGIEFNNRWTPHPHFLLDADLAWTHARFANGDRIPNAVDSVASIAATVKDIGPGRPACSGATWAAAPWSRTTRCAPARPRPSTCA
jgi:hypothetical protein